MPHTDTNISRDALRSYGMQPARTQSGERGNKENKGRESGGTIRIYSDGEDGGFGVNPAKVYVDVLAEFSRGRDGTHVYMHGGRAGSEPFL